MLSAGIKFIFVVQLLMTRVENSCEKVSHIDEVTRNFCLVSINNEKEIYFVGRTR